MRIDRSSAIPLYQQIANHFREAILRGDLQPQDILPSIRQLQRETGAGIESIKHAMETLGAQHYVHRIQGKGTFVAERRRDGAFWGIVVPFYTEFYSEAILQFREAAGEQIAIEHACDYGDWQRQVEIVSNFAWNNAAAIIVVPPRDERKSLSALLKIARHAPVILFDFSSIASQLPYVIQDYVLGVRLGCEHLAEGGARRIGFARDPLWSEKNPVHIVMEQSYRQCCADSADAYCQIWPSPYAVSNNEIRRGEFDAILCETDQVACLVTGRLREQGIEVPRAVQVMGYNNLNVGRYFTPQITTVSADLPKMCAQLRELIARLEAGEKGEMQQFVTLPRVVPRQTTRAGLLEKIKSV